MGHFILRLLIAAAGLWLASKIVPGIHAGGIGSLIVAALILGLFNAILRPILILLTLPLTLVTLGLFLLVINGAMLMLTSMFLRGFSVHGWVAAVLGSIVVSLVSWAGSTLLDQ